MDSTSTIHRALIYQKPFCRKTVKTENRKARKQPNNQNLLAATVKKLRPPYTKKQEAANQSIPQPQPPKRKK